ncbi:pentatricopeptide repeat-containing protein At3g22150, chloroplastic-like isoform X2 [Tripterygium wilfordii]|uniref:pentatricopeptide repeat-containing protein At3g22150, chloroplastic-like isoform X2 n=1 Tax=Tripterygium wilfordii TaxID=458696 RepID=UPI0018F7EADD|nr:pentatricopeptide repeat-containing protein At3g22150, chloroplastic-like isoform X2 [Tripterygium wilfordii]
MATTRFSPVASSSSALPLSTPSIQSLRDNYSLQLIPPPNPTLKTPTIRSRLSKLCQDGQPHLARQLFDTITQPTTTLWNTIIIGFICNNLPDEAILFYIRMKNASPLVKCDSYTYSSSLKACAETRNLLVGKAVHCHLIRCLSNPSMIVYNSLLNMYSTCLSTADGEVGLCDFSNYDFVRKVFDTMRKRNVVAWNTMVSWYVKTERCKKAAQQFRLMMAKGIKPTAVSFVNVFPALSSIGDYSNANVLYGMVIKLGNEYVNDLFVVSSAISMYMELGYLDIARKIFDNCLDRNTEIWNTMIGEYVQRNCPLEGIGLFLHAMDSDNSILDDVSFLSALTAISQLQCLELAQQLHAYIIKNLEAVPVNVLNAIVVMYSRCNSIQASFDAFSQMRERDVVSWNTMVFAFVQHGLDDEGLMLVHEMQKQGYRIDSVTVTALLSAASNLQNHHIGRQTHAYLLRHGLQFDGMDSYLIDMYSKSGLIRTAQLLFEKSSIASKDQATWNAMIAGYTQNGLTDNAFITFRQMFDHKLSPSAVTLASVLPACNPMGSINLGAVSYAENVFYNTLEKNSVTYTTMILGYGQNGMGKRALSLFYSMQASGVIPDSITFIAVLSACGYVGLVDEGLQIFNAMEREYNIQPSTEHYCCVVDMLGRFGRVVEAHKFVEQLGEEASTLEIWGSLLGACRLHGYVELGEAVANKLLEIDAGNGKAGYHLLLSNIYAEKGYWERADRVRKEIRERGLRKEVGCSWIEVAGHLSHFVSRDQEHPRSNDIYEMLEGLAVDMTDRVHGSF